MEKLIKLFICIILGVIALFALVYVFLLVFLTFEGLS